METISTLLMLLWPLVVYFGLLRIAGSVLPATDASRRWLRYAYRSCLATVLGYWLAYVLGGCIIRFTTLFWVLLVVSGWLAAARAQLGGLPPSLGGRLRLHGWAGLPLALLVGACWMGFTSYTPVYRDQNASVELTENFTLSDTPSWTITFYQRNALFEVAAGRVQCYGFVPGGLMAHEAWRDVRSVVLDSRNRTATVSWYSGEPVTLAYH